MKASGYSIAATELIDAVAAWQIFDTAPLNALIFDVATRYQGSDLRDQFGAVATGSKVLGYAGDDTLLSRGEDILLNGGKGNDLLIAESGLSIYHGGPGQDGFAFADPALPNRIDDFSPEDDVFLLDPDTFVGVGPAALDDAQFKIGKKASTAEQIILFWKGKGRVLYDQDGSESVYQPVQFAKVEKGLDLDARNFYGEVGGFG
jgi:Ca2+-binding RTX toxin-like protein